MISDSFAISRKSNGVEAKSHSRGNCLNLFRLLACIQVFVKHAYIHLELTPPSFVGLFDFLFQGVPIFFILSGFLIWQSVERTPDFKTFFTKRILRLYPELWLCVIIELASIAIFYEKHVGLTNYLLFGFTQATVFQFWTPDCLRDYGCGSPNGALWTIPVIVQFYLFAWLFGGILKKQGLATWGACLIVSMVVSLWKPSDLPIPVALKKLYDMTLIPHCWIFLWGSFISNFSEKIMPVIKRFWYVPLVLIVALYFCSNAKGSWIGIVKNTLLAFFMLGFAYRYKQLEFKTDISYGVYIYHMIFVNMAIALNLRGSWWVFGILLIVIAIVGYISMLWGRYASTLFVRNRK